MRTNGKLMVGVVAIALIASGCSKKVGGQVVALVNDEEITQQQLNAELQGQAIPPNADKKVIMAQLLQRVIDRKLLVQKAKADGLDRSPEYLEQLGRAQDSLLIGLLSNKAAKATPMADAAAVSGFIANQPTMFSGRKRYTLSQIIFRQPENIASLGKLQSAHSLDDVAAALKAQGVEFTRGNNMLDTATIPPQIAAKIAALPAGEPFIVPQNGQVVASVITSTEAVPTPDAQAKPAAVELIRRQAVEKKMLDDLKAERAKAKIDYEAGYAPPAKGGATPAASTAPVAK